MNEINEFVDVLPTKSINTALSVVRSKLTGQPVTVTGRDVSLAVANMVLYGAGAFFPTDGTPMPMMSEPEPTLQECEAQLAALLPDAEGTVAMQKIGDGKLLALLQAVLPYLLKLLPLIPIAA